MTGPELQYTWDEEHLARQAVRRARLFMANRASPLTPFALAVLAQAAALLVLIPVLVGALQRLPA